MKKIDLGQIITIVANLGVIAGIAFLAMQIRNDAAQAGIEAIQGMESMYIEWQLSIANDPAIAQIYTHGLEDYESLSEVEKVRFDLLMRSLLRIVYAGIGARDSVFGDPSERPELLERVLEANYFQLLEKPGFRQWWATADLRNQPGSWMLDEIDQISRGEIPAN